jgi:uncharacterized protein YqgV (UPF0045/DUF77 family)
MIGEISVIPQTDGSARGLVEKLLGEFDARGLRYDVGAAGTVVEGSLEQILTAVAAVENRLRLEGVARAMIDVRLLLEPHAETIEHQVEGLGVAHVHEPAGRPPAERQPLGLGEAQLRQDLAEELERAMRATGNPPESHTPSIEAIAHSVARILDQDHARMAEQLGRAFPGAERV